jgi:hypothetical protein
MTQALQGSLRCAGTQANRVLGQKHWQKVSNRAGVRQGAAVTGWGAVQETQRDAGLEFLANDFDRIGDCRGHMAGLECS